MTVACLKDLLKKLEVEHARHEEQYKDDTEHAACETKFAAILNELRKELQDLQGRQPVEGDETKQTARGDELAEVRHLQKVAKSIPQDRPADKAAIKNKVVETVMKELNELDGFDR